MYYVMYYAGNFDFLNKQELIYTNGYVKQEGIIKVIKVIKVIKRNDLYHQHKRKGKEENIHTREYTQGESSRRG